MELPPEEPQSAADYKKLEAGSDSDSDASSDDDDNMVAHYLRVAKEMPKADLLKYGGGGFVGLLVLYFTGILEQLALSIASQLIEGALVGCGVYFLFTKVTGMMKGEAKKVTGKIKGIGKKIKKVPVKMKDAIQKIAETLETKLKEIPEMVSHKIKEGAAKAKAKAKERQAKRKAKLQKLKNGESESDDDDKMREFQVEFDPSWASALSSRLVVLGTSVDDMPPRFTASDRAGAAVGLLPYNGGAPGVDLPQDRFPLTLKRIPGEDSDSESSDEELSTWRQRRKDAKSPAAKLADKKAELQAQKEAAMADPTGAMRGFFGKATGVNLDEVAAEKDSGGYLASAGKMGGQMFNHAAPPPAKWLSKAVNGDIKEGDTGARLAGGLKAVGITGGISAGLSVAGSAANSAAGAVGTVGDSASGAVGTVADTGKAATDAAAAAADSVKQSGWLKGASALAGVAAGAAGSVAGTAAGAAGTVAGAAGTVAGTAAGAAGTVAGSVAGTAGTVAGTAAGADGTVAGTAGSAAGAAAVAVGVRKASDELGVAAGPSDKFADRAEVAEVAELARRLDVTVIKYGRRYRMLPGSTKTRFIHVEPLMSTAAASAKKGADPEFEITLWRQGRLGWWETEAACAKKDEPKDSLPLSRVKGAVQSAEKTHVEVQYEESGTASVLELVFPSDADARRWCDGLRDFLKKLQAGA